jgi:chromosome segregation ATPase
VPVLIGNGLGLRDWIVIALIPVLTLISKLIADRKTHGLAKTGEWRSDFDSIRSEWSTIRTEWSDRLNRSEEERMECEKRIEATEKLYDDLLKKNETLDQRIAHFEGALEEMNRLLHQKNEALAVMQMELDMLKKVNGLDENGDPT